MTHMLCRNRVKDFKQWKAVFDSHSVAHREAGLQLVKLWRCIDEPNNVFFLLQVDDMDKAQEFVSSPHSAEAGKTAGVLDGEIYYVNEA